LDVNDPLPQAGANAVETLRQPTVARRVVAVGVIGFCVGLAATGLAARLDDPVQSGPRDAAPIIAGPVIIDEAETFGAKGLPPFSLILERPTPDGLIGRSRAERLAALRAQDKRNDPTLLLQVAAAEQSAGEQTRARALYDRVLKLRPNDVTARIGVAFTKAASGGADAGQAALLLQRLSEERPSNQLIAFNRGWLAAYRRDATTARLAWKQALDIDPSTNLGQTARGLLERVRAAP
jgi:hypothetical protein